MTDRRPAEVFDPRSHVRDEMRDRNLSRKFLSTHLIGWLDGGNAMDERTANGLSALFGTSPAFWLNLDRSWQRRKETHDGE